MSCVTPPPNGHAERLHGTITQKGACSATFMQCPHQEKPLIYFSLLFCTFSCFFEKSMKKYKKAQSSTFFRLFQGGQKSSFQE